MIRDRNIDPNLELGRHVVNLQHSTTVIAAGTEQAGMVMPYAGKIVALYYRARDLTDADDSVRVDVKLNGVSILAAPVDPVATGTNTTLVALTTTFAAGDTLTLNVTTASGDTSIGSLTIVFRPYLGSGERHAARAAGVAITP